MKKHPDVTVKVIFRYKNETLILKYKDGVIMNTIKYENFIDKIFNWKT